MRSLGTSDPSACSRTAVVTSVSTAQTRRTTIITAEESGRQEFFIFVVLLICMTTIIYYCYASVLFMYACMQGFFCKISFSGMPNFL